MTHMVAPDYAQVRAWLMQPLQQALDQVVHAAQRHGQHPLDHQELGQINRAVHQALGAMHLSRLPGQAACAARLHAAAECLVGPVPSESALSRLGCVALELTAWLKALPPHPSSSALPAIADSGKRQASEELLQELARLRERLNSPEDENHLQQSAWNDARPLLRRLVQVAELLGQESAARDLMAFIDAPRGQDGRGRGRALAITRLELALRASQRDNPDVPELLWQARQNLLAEQRAGLAHARIALDHALQLSSPQVLAPVAEQLQQIASSLRVMGEPVLADALDMLLAALRPPADALFGGPRRAFAALYCAVEMALEWPGDDAQKRVSQQLRAFREALGLIASLPLSGPSWLAARDPIALPEPPVVSAIAVAAPSTPQPAAPPRPPPSQPTEAQLEALAQTMVIPEYVSAELAAHAAGLSLPKPAPVAALSPASEDLDAEIRALFAEEAQQVVDEAHQHLAAVRAGGEGWVPLRRAFHTLKGSGRVAGALVMAEIAWAIEQLLNRQLETASAVAHALPDLLSDVLHAMPQLLKDWQLGQSTDANLVDGLHQRAKALLHTPREEADAPRAAFAKDAAEHLQLLHRFAQSADGRVLADAKRAAHTLKGAAATVGLTQFHAALDSLDVLLAEAFEPDGEASALAQRWLAQALPSLNAAIGAQNDADFDKPWLAALHELAQQRRAHTTPRQQDREQFCMAALDGLQLLEQHLLLWQAEPSELAYAARIQSTLADLGERAHQQQFPVWRNALHSFGDAIAAAGADPDIAARRKQLAGLATQLERLYGPLDEYRMGLAGLGTNPGLEWSPQLSSDGLDVPTASSPLNIELVFADEMQEQQGRLLQLMPKLAQGALHALVEVKRLLHTVLGSAQMAQRAEVEHHTLALLDWLETLDGSPADFPNILLRLGHSLAHHLQGPLVELPTTAVPMPEAPARGLSPSWDDDLGGIFRAESEELLEQLGRELRRWQLGQSGAVDGMLRALHTLKGSARIAGAHRMASIAHDLESLLLPQGRAKVPPGSVMRQLSQRLDELETCARSLPNTLGVEVAPVGESPWRLGMTAPVAAAEGPAGREWLRVDVQALDGMLRLAAESGIHSGRLITMQAQVKGALSEMGQTLVRLKEQLRHLELESDAKIAAGGSATAERAEFDPLELDRYTRMQELSRALGETVTDLGGLQASLDDYHDDAQGLLRQQTRLQRDLQGVLMQTLVVPFSRQLPRLARVVEQTAAHEGKQASLQLVGGEGELDRNLLDRVTPVLEHLLRNAVAHGIESPAQRTSANKPQQGTVRVALRRDGNQWLLEVMDDGGGLKLDAIRVRAARAQLPIPDDDDGLASLIFLPGFSTAETVSEVAGRGLGLDAVAAEVKALGGALEVSTRAGQGSCFTLRLPQTLSVTQVLLVQAAGDTFALPLTAIESVTRLPRTTLDAGGSVEIGGKSFALHRLGALLRLSAPTVPSGRTGPVILLRRGTGMDGAQALMALEVDGLLGKADIVSRALPRIVTAARGIAGATVLPSGQVALVLDPQALQPGAQGVSVVAAPPKPADQSAPKRILVVDDSVTIRRVAERLLTRHGYEVATVRDGLEAMGWLARETPDAVLLDIEMPKADGYEVAAFIRGSQRLSKLPILMITSRSGQKHRERCTALGVNRHLIKPWQDDVLLAALEAELREAG